MSTPLFDTGTYPVQYVLDTLLKDRSTDKNIIFATDSYADLGELYTARRHIVKDMFTGNRGSFIQPRVLKALEEQAQRTRKKAEVFTPAWVCCLMNDHTDEEWFFRKNVFFHLEGQQWTPTEGKITFPKRKHSSWKMYVDSRRLELTCGEAPYLVSRYDMATGEVLPINRRIGILDRKLRIVNENTETEEDWLFWTLRAFQSVYGYEYQGDSLLIARINLLLTFADYVRERWNREPKEEEVEEIARIVSWNIWQMDGLSGTVPVGALGESEVQTALWLTETGQERTKCQVKNWRQGMKVGFNAFREGGAKGMKFDFIIGNPPYQEETEGAASELNGQKPRTNIFQFFQEQADEVVSGTSVLIYPGRRWIHQSGKGMKQFGLKQINDIRLSKVILYKNAREVFPTADLSDGVSVVVKNHQKQTRGFNYTYISEFGTDEVFVDNPGDELIPLNPKDLSVLKKIDAFVAQSEITYLHDGIFPRTLYGIESDFVEKNPDLVRPYIDDDHIDFESEIKLLTNNKAGKAGRATWFVAKKSVLKKGIKELGEWQVAVSSANAGGQKRDNQIAIMDNHTAFGRVRVALKSFPTLREAENFFKYATSYLVKYAFLMTDESLTTLGKRVPDIIDYSGNYEGIDFSGDVDKQLFDLVGLDDRERQYVIERVDNIRR